MLEILITPYMVMRKSSTGIRCRHLPVYFADYYEGPNQIPKTLLLMAADHLFEEETIITTVMNA